MNQPPQQPQPPQRKPRYFEQPDASEKPLTLWETMVVIVSTHLGVRSRKKRHEDFRRANGLHLFVAGLLYFFLLIAGLIALIHYIIR